MRNVQQHPLGMLLHRSHNIGAIDHVFDSVDCWLLTGNPDFPFPLDSLPFLLKICTLLMLVVSYFHSY